MTDEITSESDQALLEAYRENDINAFRRALESGADPNIRIDGGSRMLPYSALCQKTELVLLLLQHQREAMFPSEEKELQEALVKAIIPLDVTTHHSLGYENARDQLLTSLIENGAINSLPDSRNYDQIVSFTRYACLANAAAQSLDNSHLTVKKPGKKLVISPVFQEIMRQSGKVSWEKRAESVEDSTIESARAIRDMFVMATKNIVLAGLVRELQKKGVLAEIEKVLTAGDVVNLLDGLVPDTALAIIGGRKLEQQGALVQFSNGGTKSLKNLQDMSGEFYRYRYGPLRETRTIPFEGQWGSFFKTADGSPLLSSEITGVPELEEWQMVVIDNAQKAAEEAARMQNRCVIMQAPEYEKQRSQAVSLRTREGVSIATLVFSIEEKYVAVNAPGIEVHRYAEDRLPGFDHIDLPDGNRVLRIKDNMRRAGDEMVDTIKTRESKIMLEWLKDRIRDGSIVVETNPTKRQVSASETGTMDKSPLLYRVGFNPSEIMPDSDPPITRHENAFRTLNHHIRPPNNRSKRLLSPWESAEEFCLESGIMPIARRCLADILQEKLPKLARNLRSTDFAPDFP